MNIARIGHRLNARLHASLDARPNAVSHPHAYLYTTHVRTLPTRWYDTLLDSGLLPDTIIRAGIRSRLRAHDNAVFPHNAIEIHAHNRHTIEQLRTHDIAIGTPTEHSHNAKLPASFYELMLGRSMLDTPGLWSAGAGSLDAAAHSMHTLIVSRAQIRDGMHILVLGAGWGSFPIWLAKQYPDTTITAITDGARKHQHITHQCEALDIYNTTPIVGQSGSFAIEGRFDRILLLSGLEHLRNLELPLERATKLLTPDGLLFVQAQTHRVASYQEKPGQTWVSRNFTVGGLTPSTDTLAHFQRCVELRDDWQIAGNHLALTADAWLANLDANEPSIMYIFRRIYGSERAATWFNRWRVYCMAIAERTRTNDGCDWVTSHCLFQPRPARALTAPIIEVKLPETKYERTPKLFAKALAM